MSGDDGELRTEAYDTPEQAIEAFGILFNADQLLDENVDGETNENESGR